MEFKVDDVSTLFQSGNAVLRIALFGSEMNYKASDINGVLSAIESARIVLGANADNLNVLAIVYTHARNQLVTAGIEGYTHSSNLENGENVPSEKNGLFSSGKMSELWHCIVSALPAILKGAADIMFGMLF